MSKTIGEWLDICFKLSGNIPTPSGAKPRRAITVERCAGVEAANRVHVHAMGMDNSSNDIYGPDEERALAATAKRLADSARKAIANYEQTAQANKKIAEELRRACDEAEG